MADKPVTIRELKTFIEAVEFAADSEDEWIPSKRQWIRIRSMIERLEETPATATTPPTQSSFQPPTAFAPPVMIDYGPSRMSPGGFGGQQMPLSPSSPPPGAPFAIGAPQLPVRTPDIDTSIQPYKSSFA